MLRPIHHAALTLSTSTSTSTSAMAADNSALFALREADRADRSIEGADWTDVRERDQERVKAVRAELEWEMVRTASDSKHAAMIFQHGEGREGYRIAHALATIATTLEPSPSNLWLSAATFDRLLVSHDVPQWYET